MNGTPMKIILKPDGTPFALNTPGEIPYTLHDAVKEQWQSMVEQGIIEPCGDDPSQCHPLMDVSQLNGVLIMVDLTKLNNQVASPIHSSMTPLAAIHTIASAECTLLQLTAYRAIGR